MTIEPEIAENYNISFKNIIDLIIAILIVADTFLFILLDFPILDSEN